MKALSRIREGVSYKTKGKIIFNKVSTSSSKNSNKESKTKQSTIITDFVNGIFDQYFSILKLSLCRIKCFSWL